MFRPRRAQARRMRTTTDLGGLSMFVFRSRFARSIRARPRLFIATIIAALVMWLLPDTIARQVVTRALIAWNTGTCLYLVLATVMMMRSSQARMQRRAQLQDEGRN